MRTKLFLISILFTTLSFFSCKKDESGNIIIPSLKVNIDGTGWDSAPAGLYSETAGTITITALSLKGEILSIVIKATTAGTYELKPSMSDASFKCFISYKASKDASETAGAGNSNYLVSTAGSVTITEINMTDKWIKGTFMGTIANGVGGASSKKLEGGQFTVLFK